MTADAVAARVAVSNNSHGIGWKDFLASRGLFYQHGITSIPAWMSNRISSKVWDEITYPFPNFNGAAVEVWE